MKLLALVDSPTENTGFACVARNTLKHWLPHFDRIDIWGINYNGYPHEYPYRIYPVGAQWSAVKNLDRLLKHIRASDYTHLWILQDTFLLSDNSFPKVLRELCDKKKILVITYYPVDAPLEHDWLDIVEVSDRAATYTSYGEEETLKWYKAPRTLPPINVIPHGVDTEVFRPLDALDRWKLREEFFPEWVGAIVLVNVNRNERRKSMVHSLQVLRELIDVHGPTYKLYLHCLARNQQEGIDLYQIGERLGLKYGTDWLVPHDEDFSRGIGGFTQEEINNIYNAADVCITTSLGEGWGLSITEAAAAGLPVVAPDHTSIPDIQRIINGESFPVGQTGCVYRVPCIKTGIVHPNDNSRIRYPVNIEAMATQIHGLQPTARRPLRDIVKQALSWERIAKEWLDIF